MVASKGPNFDTVLKAVDVLSALSEHDWKSDENFHIDLESNGGIPTEVTDEERVTWLSREHAAVAVEILRNALEAVNQYLELYLEEHDLEKSGEAFFEGLHNMILLVGEVTARLDMELDIESSVHIESLEELPEYARLKECYQKKILVRYRHLATWTELANTGKQTVEDEYLWRQKGNRANLRDMLLDLETLRSDTNYEFFHLLNDDGTPFFDKKLERNLKILCNFGMDASIYHGADPLVGIRGRYERALHHGAK